MRSVLLFLWSHRLLAVAFIVGASVLSFELTAARIAAPYVGDTVYTWTSIIGVVLAALATGYAVGGYLSDKRLRISDVSLILIIAALCIAVVAIFKDSVLSALVAIDMPLQLQALIASTFLFAPASFFMGMVAPYLARISITEVKTSGRMLSRVNAAETFGSLFGTFLTGYVLFGYLSINAILLTTAALLLATSLIVKPIGRQGLRTSAVVFLLFSALTASSIGLPGTIAEFSTPYTRIIVRELPYGSGVARAYQTDNRGLQSGILPNNPDELLFGYTRAFGFVSILADDSRRQQLIIGGGAYTFPEYLARANPQSQIDVVEVDDQLQPIAVDYFDFDQQPNLRIITADGRQFLNQNTKQYDAIYVDAFNSIIPPFQLLTVESYERARAALDDDGLLVINLISAISGEDAELLEYTYSSLLTQFSTVRVTQVDADINRSQSQNLLVVASNSPINESSIDLASDAFPEFTQQYLTPLAVESDFDQTLTDSFAPVERLAPL